MIKIKSKAQIEVDEFLSTYSNKDLKSIVPTFTDEEWNEVLNQSSEISNFTYGDPFNVPGVEMKAKLSKNIILDDDSILPQGTVIDHLNLLFLDEDWDIEFLSSSSEKIRENNTTYEAFVNGKSFFVKLSELILFEPKKNKQ